MAPLVLRSLLLLALALLRPAAAATNGASGGDGSSAPPKVRHFVTLLMENRAADHVFGCFGLPGFDGIPPEGRVLYADPSNKSAGSVNVTCGRAPYRCSANPVTHKAAKYPHYDIFAGKFAPAPTNASAPPPYPADPGQPYPWGPGGRYPLPDRTCATSEGPCGACTYPYAPQSDLQNSFHRGAAGVDIMCYGRDQLPVKSAIASSFGVFNRYYTSVPSGSMPNHMFLQSGTSCGATSNEIYTHVGGPTVSYPQDTIFDHMNRTLGAESFALFLNDTSAKEWPCADANCSGLFDMDMNVPDVIMEGVARHKQRFLPHTEFYERAANGTLPQFSYILPSNAMSDREC
jgi:phospholipase C